MLAWLVCAVAWAAGPTAEQVGDPMFAGGQAWVAAAQQRRPVRGRARGVVLVVGDGMGISTLTAARILAGQQAGATGEEGALSWETFPESALVKTYGADAQVNDSAATATALMTGVKVNIGTIGVPAAVTRGDCASQRAATPLRSLAAWAHASGRATGVVTTTRVTHATPASTYAHAAHRSWEADVDRPAGAEACPDIAAQLVDSPLDVVLGGGAANFLSVEEGGRRGDGRDLLAAWTSAGGTVLRSRAALSAFDPSTAGRVLGVFAPSHLSWVAERGPEEPSLSDMVSAALDVLSRDRDGYFLLVEGGRIDHAHHDGQPRRALVEAVELSETVAMLAARLDPRRDLILVTADHSHVMTMAGYPERGNDILGVVRFGGVTADPRDGEPILAADGLPYPTLSYVNGPGGAVPRAAPIPDPLADGDIPSALVPLDAETHGGEDVAVHGRGPWAWLLGGTIEQSDLYHLMAHALGLRPGR